MEELNVKVESVIYPKPDAEVQDWFLLRTDKGIVKGKMSWRPGEGELLKLEGAYEIRDGERQFKFKTAMANLPVSEYDKLRYICEKTKGFGTSMMQQIWEQWGDRWQEDIQAGIIKTLNGDKYKRILEAMNDLTVKAEEVEAIAWLMSKGATTNLAQLAWKEWEKNTVGIVNTDCYRLADLPNYGFTDVDSKVRTNFGIADDDPRRIQAAVVYSIKQLTGSGSTAINWDALKNNAYRLIGGHYHQLIVEAVNEMFGTGDLIGFRRSRNISLKQDYKNAQIIWDFIR